MGPAVGAWRLPQAGVDKGEETEQGPGGRRGRWPSLQSGSSRRGRAVFHVSPPGPFCTHPAPGAVTVDRPRGLLTLRRVLW